MREIIANFIVIFANVLTFAIIIRALLSWFSAGGGHPATRFLVDITEPVLAPIRRVLPGAGMIDFSPIIALLLIQFVSNLLVSQI